MNVVAKLFFYHRPSKDIANNRGMAWLLTFLLLALIALTVAYLVIAPPDALTKDKYKTTPGVVCLAAICTFLLLQSMLVIGVCRAHTRHHHHRR